jgi:hypothetical protein
LISHQLSLLLEPLAISPYDFRVEAQLHELVNISSFVRVILVRQLEEGHFNNTVWIITADTKKCICSNENLFFVLFSNYQGVSTGGRGKGIGRVGHIRSCTNQCSYSTSHEKKKKHKSKRREREVRILQSWYSYLR